MVMVCVEIVARWSGSIPSPWAQGVLRASSQVIALAALSSLVRVSESVWGQTQATLNHPRRAWSCWCVIGALALVWGLSWWLAPVAMGPFIPAASRLVFELTSGPLAALAFLLVSVFLWRLVDAVSLEWTIREYTGKTPSPA
jgi:hypothetical protein